MKKPIRVFYKKLLQTMGDPATVFADGATVGECLDDLVRQFPKIEPLLFDKQHRVHEHLLVFVNAESVTKAELTRPTKENDTIIIALLAAGG